MKKNILMIAGIFLVTVTLFSVGTYAYFAVNFQDERTKENKQNTTSLKTCELAEATTVSNIPDSIGSFTSTNIYPGHKEVASFSVTSNGELGATSTFNLVYHVLENGLKDNVSVSIYQSDEIILTTENYFECEKQTETVNGITKYYETCQEKELGKKLVETTLRGGVEDVTLFTDTIYVSKENMDFTNYYYVVVEFLNQEENQNEIMSTTLKGTIDVELTVDNTKYRECILNGMDPVLKDELIPVIIENDGTVKKADTTKKWYSYGEKLWANAVILKDESISYNNNEEIPEENIESYFVWIPKYRYQLWDLGNYSGLTDVDTTKVHTISVVFGDYNTSDEVSGECTTPMTSGNPGNCALGDYMTHPAFISIPSTGFWVGKFETSKSNDAIDNSINPSGIQIKPNKVSWRNIQVANAFYSTYDYKRNLDSHMMKNTEWGAIAYLQHSEYGSHSNVRFNNNSEYITGYASVNAPTCGYIEDNRDCKKYGTTEDITLPYNTDTGYLASTTGNISGIYDMSGGTWEYVMGVMADMSGTSLSGQNALKNSGFTGPFGEGGSLTTGLSFPDNRYYDVYTNGTVYEYYRRILGDATGELGSFADFLEINNIFRPINSWYKGLSYFICKELPWVRRGGAYAEGNNSGIYNFATWNGVDTSNISYRLILTPQ